MDDDNIWMNGLADGPMDGWMSGRVNIWVNDGLILMMKMLEDVARTGWTDG